MIKKILFALTFVFAISKLNSQTINVNSSSFSPSAPLECNDLLITVNGVANCINYQYDSIGYTISGTSIEVGVYYTGGIICAGALSPFVYTANLGNVPSGNYTVSIKGYLNLSVDDNLAAPNIVVGSCCPVAASYTSDLTVGCTGDAAPITFTNTSVGATSSEWFIDNISAGTGSTLTLPTSVVGSYDVKLVSTDGSCSDSLVQTYNVYNNPVIDLGSDTTSCLGLTYNIDAPAGFNNYEWTNNTSTTETAMVTSSNTYKVTVTDVNGCSASDSIMVTFNTPPSFTLGNDTTICSGDGLILDPGVYDSYIWNTSETTQTIEVTNSFNYGVTVTDTNGCSASDNISVLVNSSPNVNIGNDTTEICAGNSATFNAGNFSSYLWSTTETSASISTGIEGIVNVVVTDANGCSNSDETYLKVNSLPNINFGADTLSFCAGNSVTLSPGTFNNYTWSTSATTSTLNVNTEGTVSVTVTDLNACSNTDSVFVMQNENPIVSLGEDKDLCATDKLNLIAGTFSSYLWNNGSTLSMLEVNGADYPLGNNSFDVEVTDNNGCKGTDEIIINVKECDVAISSVALENSISIYPIPAKDFINLQLEGTSISLIKVYNILGKEVIFINTQTLDTNSSIDISSLNKGIYFIEFTINNERFTKQFLKN